MSIEIIPLLEADIAKVTHALKTMIASDIYGLTLYSSPGYSSFLRDFFSLPACFRDSYFFGAYRKNELLGFSEWKKTGDTLFLNLLFILPEYQSRGIGLMLLQHGRSLAKEMNCSWIELDVFASNQRACKWYAALGFDQIAMKHWLVGKNPSAHLPLSLDVVVKDYPQAIAAHERFGFSRFAVAINESEYAVGRIRDELYRVHASDLESCRDLFSVLNSLEEQRALLLISDNECLTGFRKICSSLRMRRGIES